MDYRTELREAKARVDQPAHRVILDEMGYSLDLLLHALESQLDETGITLNLLVNWTHLEISSEFGISGYVDTIVTCK